MQKKIEDLDRQIIELINQRARQYISELHQRGDEPMEKYSPADARHSFALIDSINQGPISNDAIKKIFTEIISHSVSIAAPLTVAYLGPRGTFTQIAMLEFFGESVQSISMETIPDVFGAVESGIVPFGVVPIENSTEGAVTYTLDELLDTNLSIVSEKFLRISYCLLSPASDLSAIRVIYAHPQSFGQCKGWLRANLPNAEIRHTSSNARSAEMAAADPVGAAIAPEICAPIYSLAILARAIEDSKQNHTRFLILGKRDNKPSGNDKTSIVCAVRDKPGALYNMLKPFQNANINMTKIESRPDKKKVWAYNFFIDFKGHKDNKTVRKAMERMREETIFFKILGSYPAGD